MIKIENTEVSGWEAAIRGMRNPLNSWSQSDSHKCNEILCDLGYDCEMAMNNHASAFECNNGDFGYCVGEKDFALMKKLADAGADHRKFMRFITVTADITAPLYWWKEYDTYKVGTAANSCSTMHTIHRGKFKLNDFSNEHLNAYGISALMVVIKALNANRDVYLNGYKGRTDDDSVQPKDKEYWWQMIQLLPSSYNQRRTVMLNYEVLRNMYHARKAHKLDEWREGFCQWAESLPYSELITGCDKIGTHKADTEPTDS